MIVNWVLAAEFATMAHHERLAEAARCRQLPPLPGPLARRLIAVARSTRRWRTAAAKASWLGRPASPAPQRAS